MSSIESCLTGLASFRPRFPRGKAAFGVNFCVAKGCLVCCLGLAAWLFLVAGCSDRTAKLAAAEGKAFAGAPTEVKQGWDKALAAEKVKDYVAAQTAFMSLSQMTLNDEQRKALEDERAAFGQRLTEAANNNNPAAIAALKLAIKNRGAR